MFMMFLMCIFHIEILDYSIPYGIHVKIPFETGTVTFISPAKDRAESSFHQGFPVYF